MTSILKPVALGAALAFGAAAPVLAAGEGHVEDYDFSFEGPFGSYDPMQLQRGLKIYHEICSGCHGLEYVAFRTLESETGPALPEEQMRAFAEMYEVWDPALFDGEGDYRPATPSDHFPESQLANAPDLSLMAKARAGFHGPYGTGISQLINGMGGAEYIASLLTGYEEPPECTPDGFEGYYNVAFSNGGYPAECIDEEGHHMYPGSWIAMPQPLYGDDTDFDDGHANDLENEAKDVAAFLMWAAEPKLVQRKQAGLTGVIFLAVLAALLYLTNKRIWAPIKHRNDHD